MSIRHRIWRGVDRGAAIASMFFEPFIDARQKMQSVGTPVTGSTKSYIFLTAEFGSMGDQALAAGIISLIRRKKIRGTCLVPGEVDRWHEVGLGSVQSMSQCYSGFCYRMTPLGKRLTATSSIYIVGADTIDGKYDHAALAFRIRALNNAARNGQRSGLVNFSLSEHPTRTSLALLRMLDSRVEMWARDHNSQRRARALLNRQVDLAADVGMFLEADNTERVDRLFAVVDARDTVVLVPNAHFATHFDIPREILVHFWADLAQRMSQRFHVVVMPHDSRSIPDDIGLAQSIDAKVENSSLSIFIPETAAEAKGVLARSGICIAARMHACVGALSVGTPTVGLDYLDKFVGQFEWFGDYGITIPFSRSLDVNEVSRAVFSLSNIGDDRDEKNIIYSDGHTSIPWI